MKRWRRSGGLGLAAAAAVSPSIVSVVTDGSDTAVVTFSSAIVLSAPGGCTLELDGQNGGWQSQINATHLAWIDLSGNPHFAAETWSMLGPEALLAPAPVLPESGVTV